MKRLVFLFLVFGSGGCCIYRPCPAVLNGTTPCRAQGEGAEDWRIATEICRSYDAAGAGVELVYVRNGYLSVTFEQDFARQLLADRVALQEYVAELMVRMRRETGKERVSVELTAGAGRIAAGEVSPSGEDQITILD